MAANVKILATVPGMGGNRDMIEVRFLVNGNTVKYGLIYIGAYHDGWYKPDQVDTVVLPDLPEEWTWVCICAHHETGEPFVLNYHNNPPEREEVAVWHSTSFEYTDIEKIHQIRMDKQRKEDRMWIVQHPSMDKRCLMKIAEVPKLMDFVKRETDAYRVLEGSGIAPQFMGHVTEQGRVVGILVEWIEDAVKPELELDMEMVLDALSSLHERGIVHKDPHMGNFLIKDNRVYIIDFEYARQTSDPSEFDFEIDRVIGQSSLWDNSPSLDHDES
ncbi:hypothetical protein F5X96DRAFT_674888 [Biscogniauxia mediterranea]|nr:hypothetical protein F5X96DRAFT_674888 [Biscogniauxia mediterranea]